MIGQNDSMILSRKKTMWSRIVLAVICLWPLLSMGGEKPTLPPLAAVASLDVPRYMGTWYEIAKYPNRDRKSVV